MVSPVICLTSEHFMTIQIMIIFASALMGSFVAFILSTVWENRRFTKLKEILLTAAVMVFVFIFAYLFLDLIWANLSAKLIIFG